MADGYADFWGGAYSPLYGRSNAVVRDRNMRRDAGYKSILALIAAMRAAVNGGDALTPATRITAVAPHNDYSGIRDVTIQQFIPIDSDEAAARAISAVVMNSRTILPPSRDLSGNVGRSIGRGR